MIPLCDMSPRSAHKVAASRQALVVEKKNYEWSESTVRCTVSRGIAELAVKYAPRAAVLQLNDCLASFLSV